MIVAEKNRRRLAGQPRVLKAIDRHVDLLHRDDDSFLRRLLSQHSVCQVNWGV